MKYSDTKNYVIQNIYWSNIYIKLYIILRTKNKINLMRKL